MNAIVLAAGPMRLGDTVLIERSLSSLQKAGVTQALVVVDHLHEMLEEVLRTRFDAGYFRVIVNPDHARGSASLLMCAADALAGEVLLLEASIFYHEAVIARMAALSLDNALAMGRFRNHGVARIRLRGSYVQSLVFDQQDAKTDGDWVGITRLSSSAAAALRDALQATGPSDNGQTPHYTDYVCRLVERFRFRAVSIDDLP